MALSLKEKLFDYFAIKHLDLMKPDVRARFKDFAKNKDFRGNMKDWIKKGYINDDGSGVAIPTFDSAIAGAAPNPYELSTTEWEELYDAFQQTFEEMDSHKTPSFGIKKDYKDATITFINTWFGNDPKTFTQTTADRTIAEPLINSLLTFLENGRTATPPANPYKSLNATLSKALKENVFSDGLDYDGFLDGLRNKKYNSNIGFRKKMMAVIEHIKYYGPNVGYESPGVSVWPKNIGYTAVGGTVNTVDPVLQNIQDADTSKWFVIERKNERIDLFKRDFYKISDTLLTNATVRKDFIESAPQLLSKTLGASIEQTDYENKESPDYIPPKEQDEKNILQILEDWKNDTYENHLRRFVNPSRGTRLFFSPWSQNIIKAFDKEKIKPTDGLDGILSKKDAILKRLTMSKNATEHFEWFAKKMDELKNEIPKAYEGALRNGAQMRQLVSVLITKAAAENSNAAFEKAQTALEILSVVKYGLTCSRTYDRLKDATKDMKIFSDEKLSWNKNEGIQFVTKAFDATMGLALRGIGLAATTAHNFIQHRRTKIGKNLKDNPTLNSAYKNWQEQDTENHNRQTESNRIHNVDEILRVLNDPARAAGGGTIPAPAGATAPLPVPATFKTNIQINADNVETIKEQLENARSATPPATTVTIGTRTVNINDLDHDVALFEDANERHKKETNWRKNNPDRIHRLIAYWDSLESYAKSHALTLGSMEVKRKAMQKKEGNDKTRAQNLMDKYYQRFGPLKTK